MDAKEKKKTTIRIVAGVIMIILVALLGYLIFGGGEEEPERVTRLGPSDSMVPSDPSEMTQAVTGELIVNPAGVIFTGDQPSQIVAIQANGAPIVLLGFDVPPDAATSVTVSSIDCPAAPQPLPAGSSCSISVDWNGTAPVSSFIDVKGSIFNSEGGENITPVTVALPITAQQVADISGNGVAGVEQPAGFNGDVGALPSQTGGYDGGPAGGFAQGGEPAAQPALSPRQQQRNAYLESRRSGTLAGVGVSGNADANGMRAAARSRYSGWDDIGAAGRTSSLPTDMSRVLTPDKPITAVISVPIDTRNPVTAVAMVDRDIYGNNGRTVVIPRGSKLIGTPGVSDQRVGVAWRQLIRPDGTRFVFEGTAGDAMGRGGIPGRINRRDLERYGFSLIPTALAAGVTAALGGNQVNAIGGGGFGDGAAGGVGGVQVLDARAVAAQILAQPLNQISQDIAERYRSIPVQIVVPAGTRITIWSVDDLRLKPAGERDPVNTQAQNQNQRNQGINRTQQGGFNGVSGRQSNQPVRNNGPEGSEDIDSYEVGAIDESGNYIAPGSRAPSPSTAPLNRQRRGE